MIHLPRSGNPANRRWTGNWPAKAADAMVASQTGMEAIAR